VRDRANGTSACWSGCRETDGVGAGQNDGRDLLRAHAMTLRINVAITRMARTTPYPSEQDPMTALPQAFAKLKRIHAALERHYRDMQDLEFTVEQLKRWRSR
jgi:hypothetical protein